MGAWIARISVRHGKSVLFAWLLLVLLAAGTAVHFPDRLKDHGLRPGGSYAEAERELSHTFGIPMEPVVLILTGEPDLTTHVTEFASTTAIEAAVSDAEALALRVEGVRRVKAPPPNSSLIRDSEAAIVLDADAEAVAKLRQVLRTEWNNPGINVRLAGAAAVQMDVNEISRHDLVRAERIGLPLALLLTAAALGGLLPALLPLAAGLAAVVVTMGLLVLIGQQVAWSSFVIDVVPMVGLALGIDFALLLVSRFREEQARGSTEQALARTMATAGRTISLSAACIFLGLLATSGLTMPLFRTVAWAAMLVLVLSWLAAVTLLPALLAQLAPFLPRSKTRASGTWTGRGLRALAQFALRRPVSSLLLAVAALALCIMPLGSLRLEVPDASSLPSDSPSRQAAELYEAKFVTPGCSSVWLIARSAGKTYSLQDWKDAATVVRHLAVNPDVIAIDSVFSRTGLDPEWLYSLQKESGALKDPLAAAVAGYAVQGNSMLIGLTLNGEPGTAAAMQAVRAIPEFSGGLILQAVGDAKSRQLIVDDVKRHAFPILLFVFLGNLTLLVAVYRCFIVPLKAILTNLLSIAAALGVVTWLFGQSGLAGAPAQVAVMIPAFLFGLAFGMSMDYGIFLLSRIREEYVQSQDNDQSIGEGIARTGPIISAAAAIMIAVTLPFALGGVTGVRQLGVGISAAVLLDATLIRFLLVPAVMKLLGRWNWGWQR